VKTVTTIYRYFASSVGLPLLPCFGKYCSQKFSIT